MLRVWCDPKRVGVRGSQSTGRKCDVHAPESSLAYRVVLACDAIPPFLSTQAVADIVEEFTQPLSFSPGPP
jgi:hypothetical protein